MSADLTICRGFTAINDETIAEPQRSWRWHCSLCRTCTAVAPRLRCEGGINPAGQIWLTRRGKGSSIIVIIFTSVHSVLFFVNPSQKRTLKMLIRNIIIIIIIKLYYCITLYFRGRKISRKVNLKYFREKIFSRIYCSRENIFPRKYLPAKITTRENNFPRKYLLGKISSRENIFLRMFPYCKICSLVL